VRSLVGMRAAAAPPASPPAACVCASCAHACAAVVVATVGTVLGLCAASHPALARPPADTATGGIDKDWDFHADIPDRCASRSPRRVRLQARSSASGVASAGLVRGTVTFLSQRQRCPSRLSRVGCCRMAGSYAEKDFYARDL
jgi:hypothetical protein